MEKADSVLGIVNETAIVAMPLKKSVVWLPSKKPPDQAAARLCPPPVPNNLPLGHPSALGEMWEIFKKETGSCLGR